MSSLPKNVLTVRWILVPSIKQVHELTHVTTGGTLTKTSMFRLHQARRLFYPDRDAFSFQAASAGAHSAH